MTRLRNKQRGQKIADCFLCGEEVWSTQASVITRTVPAKILHEICVQLAGLDVG